MKKIFTYLAVAAFVAVACDDMYGPVETPVAPDKAGSVEIQIDTLGDDTLAFTLSPVGDAAYYSYFVAAGPAQAVDSVAVYQCKLDGLIKGTFKAAEDSVAHLALGELAPNTPYTIYAVAGSPMGIAGSIAVKEVVTTDGITIKVVDFDDTVTDSTVVLTFSEEVFPGKGEITATYYASNLGFKEMGTVKAVADSVIFDGKTVTVQFAGLPHGAHWAVSYPEGTFTDSAQNEIAALTSGYSSEAKKMVGVCSRKDTVAFALEAAFPKEQQMFNDWTKAEFTVGLAVDSTLAVAGKAKPVVNYVTSGKVLTIDLVEKETYGFDENGVWMNCPEEPAFGTKVVFSYPQDSFQDIWGNPTKEVDLATLCAYDYVFEDVIGTYDVVYESIYTEGPQASSMKIEALADSKDGNVKITNFLGIDCVKPIVGNFNPSAGTLTISDWQYFAEGQDYYYDEEGYPVIGDDGNPIILDVSFYFVTYSEAPLVLQMTEKGVFEYAATSSTAYPEMFGIYDVYMEQPYTFYDLLYAFVAEKTDETDSNPAPAAVPSKVQKPMLTKRF